MPSQPARETYLVNRISHEDTNASRTTLHAHASGLPGFVPIDSGGTARESHPLPLPWSHNVEGTIGERHKACQVRPQVRPIEGE
jgi:hypothetical protein